MLCSFVPLPDFLQTAHSTPFSAVQDAVDVSHLALTVTNSGIFTPNNAFLRVYLCYEPRGIHSALGFRRQLITPAGMEIGASIDPSRRLFFLFADCAQKEKKCGLNMDLLWWVWCTAVRTDQFSPSTVPMQTPMLVTIDGSSFSKDDSVLVVPDTASCSSFTDDLSLASRLHVHHTSSSTSLVVQLSGLEVDATHRLVCFRPSSGVHGKDSRAPFRALGSFSVAYFSGVDPGLLTFPSGSNPIFTLRGSGLGVPLQWYQLVPTNHSLQQSCGSHTTGFSAISVSSATSTSIVVTWHNSDIPSTAYGFLVCVRFSSSGPFVGATTAYNQVFKTDNKAGVLLPCPAYSPSNITYLVELKLELLPSLLSEDADEFFPTFSPHFWPEDSTEPLQLQFLFNSPMISVFGVFLKSIDSAPCSSGMDPSSV